MGLCFYLRRRESLLAAQCVLDAADGVLHVAFYLVYAVLSVGGFLGMGTRLVVIHYDSLKFADNKIVLPGGTKDGLKMLPAFQYSKD